MKDHERQQLKAISRKINRFPMTCKKCGGVLAILDMKGKPKPAEVKKLERLYKIKAYCQCNKCGAYYLAMKLDQ